MKRVAFVVVAIACRIAAAATPEWTIVTPPDWVASEASRDAVEDLARSLPGAIPARATVTMYTAGDLFLGVIGMVVRIDDRDAREQIAAIEHANRQASAVKEVRYESSDVAGQHVVSQQVDVGERALLRRRIYAAASDRMIHYVDASCTGDAERCRAVLATLQLHVEPAAEPDEIGWLIARIAAGVVAIALGAWLAVRFRRR